ncbi:response regulator transcription factor [Intrasporangium calvum]|uniref:Response regulator transcription factor n=1 Tax=Intrasporangium calvum TaxID=53358 RepID=A0ABT5GCZ2_9MICO|nr:response regulator transcription factor [Intrasporangium calvum]MDC5695994.1 response regulator transcription factor [Intrasporangium calvum]
MRPIRVVVADDQPIIRDGFAAVLGAQVDLEVVGRAADGIDLVEMIESGPAPDIALVDIRMPRLDGIAATARISGRTKVLILTTFDLDEYVHDALVAGASGFLLKDVPADRLVEAVRLVAEGSLLLGPTITRRLVQEVATRRPPDPPDLGALGLTAREQQVFALLARGRSNREVADELFLAVETVKSHVSEVLRKLELRDRVQAVVYAYDSGLVPVEVDAATSTAPGRPVG